MHDFADASPASLRPEAHPVAEAFRQTNSDYGVYTFCVEIASQAVHIPQRIHVTTLETTGWSPIQRDIAHCLLTRSTDGFVRQAALKSVLAINTPWAIPFVIALVGEYVVEILEDIHTGLPHLDRTLLTDFFSANPNVLPLTRARVASYWNCYYRGRNPRRTYVGFRLIRELDALVSTAAA